MVWQIVNKVDTEKARQTPLFVRTPFLEMEGLRKEGVEGTDVNKKWQ